jgi:hypothetical protein
MEVLLNTIWLLVAIAAVLFWLALEEQGAAARHEHSQSYRVVALACVLILLFPVISVTDDLHQEQAVMEDSSRSAMKSRALAEGCLRAGRVSPPAILATLASFVTAPQVCVAKVAPIESQFHPPTPICPPAGRAPPLSTRRITT